MKDKLNKFKQFVIDHKYETAVAVGFTAGFVITRMALNVHYNNVWDPASTYLEVSPTDHRVLADGQGLIYGVYGIGIFTVLDLTTVTDQTLEDLSGATANIREALEKSAEAA